MNGRSSHAALAEREMRRHRSMIPLLMWSLAAILSVTFLSLAGICHADDQLTIKDIVDMSRRGISDDIIIEKIRSSETRLDLTVNEIIAVKRKGVSNTVIRELIRAPEMNIEDMPTALPTKTAIKPSSKPTPTPAVPVERDLTPFVEVIRDSESENPPTPDPRSAEERIDVSWSNSSDEEATADATPTPDPLDGMAVISDRNFERGIFRIRTNPTKAQVIFDGKTVGVTPYYTNMVLDGLHKLVLRKEFYRDLKVEIDLQQESLRDLFLTLELERPMILLNWKIDDDGLSSLRWSTRNCPEPPDEHTIQLTLDSAERTEGILYYVDLNHVGTIPNDATACLQGMIWLPQNPYRTPDRDEQFMEPDIIFYLTGIAITTEKIVEITLNASRDRRYPQGLRLIFSGDSGHLLRTSP